MPLFNSSYTNPLFAAAQAGRAARFQSGYASTAPTEPEDADEPLAIQPSATALATEAAPQSSLAASAGNLALSGIGAVGNLLDLPASSIRDFATWAPGGIEAQNPLDQWMDPVGKHAETNRIEGRDLLRSGGFVGKKDNWGNFAGGLVLEMAMDPLSYLGLPGVGRLGKGMQATGLLTGSARKQLIKELAEEGGKKLKYTGGSLKYGLTAKQVFGLLEKSREKAAKALAQQVEGTRKGTVFNKSSDLGDAKNGAWALVDEGGEYKIHRHINDDPTAKGSWKVDDAATELYKQQLSPSASKVTRNRAYEISKNAYDNLYGSGFEEALAADEPLYNFLSVALPKVPFVKGSKWERPLIQTKDANQWWDRRMNRLPELADDAAQKTKKKKKKGPQNAAPGEDVPVDAGAVVKEAEAAAAGTNKAAPAAAAGAARAATDAATAGDNLSPQAAAAGGTIPTADFDKYVLTGEIGDEHLNTIADKIAKGVKLSDQEQSVLNGKTQEVETILQGKQAAAATATPNAAGAAQASPPPSATNVPPGAAQDAAWDVAGDLSPDIVAKLKEAGFDDEAISGMSLKNAYDELEEALKHGVIDDIPPRVEAPRDSVSPQVPPAALVPETPATTPPPAATTPAAPTADVAATADADYALVTEALRPDETTKRGQRIREIFEARGAEETVVHFPVMEATIKSLAAGSKGVYTEEDLWGRISLREFANDAALDKAIKDAGGVEKLFQPQLAEDAVDFAGASKTQQKAATKEWREKGTGSSFFKRWFGDWEKSPENASKITWEGKPLSLYHGTKRDFNSFDATAETAVDGGWYGKGHYFTVSGEGASRYAGNQVGSRVMSAYIDIKNPAVVEVNNFKSTYPNENVGEIFKSVYGDDPTSHLDAGKSTEITKRLREAGYDGVVVNQDGLPLAEVVAFDANQIKSATGNTGEFSPSTGNILHQKEANKAQARGAILQGDTKSLIALFTGKADASTVMHEFAHFMRKYLPSEMGDDAAGAVEQLLSKIKWKWKGTRRGTIQHYTADIAGVKHNIATIEKSGKKFSVTINDAANEPIKNLSAVFDTAKEAKAYALEATADARLKTIDADGKWGTFAEEAFARAWERYLRDGVAPKGSKLDLVFKEMKRLLKQVYDQLTGNNLDINPKLKSIFDRLLADGDATGVKAAADVPPAAALGDAATGLGRTDVGGEIDPMASLFPGGRTQNLSDALPPRDPMASLFPRGRSQNIEDALPPSNLLSDVVEQGRTVRGEVAGTGADLLLNKAGRATDPSFAPTINGDSIDYADTSKRFAAISSGHATYQKRLDELVEMGLLTEPQVAVLQTALSKSDMRNLRDFKPGAVSATNMQEAGTFYPVRPSGAPVEEMLQRAEDWKKRGIAGEHNELGIDLSRTTAEHGAQTLAHELGHLASFIMSKEDPELFQQGWRQIEKLIKDGTIREYMTFRTDLSTADYINSSPHEVIAEMMSQSVMQKAKMPPEVEGILQKIAAKLTAWINKIVETIKPKDPRVQSVREFVEYMGGFIPESERASIMAKLDPQAMAGMVEGNMDAFRNKYGRGMQLSRGNPHFKDLAVHSTPDGWVVQDGSKAGMFEGQGEAMDLFAQLTAERQAKDIGGKDLGDGWFSNEDIDTSKVLWDGERGGVKYGRTWDGSKWNRDVISDGDRYKVIPQGKSIDAEIDALVKDADATTQGRTAGGEATPPPRGLGAFTRGAKAQGDSVAAGDVPVKAADDVPATSRMPREELEAASHQTAARHFEGDDVDTVALILRATPNPQLLEKLGIQDISGVRKQIENIWKEFGPRTPETMEKVSELLARSRAVTPTPPPSAADNLIQTARGTAGRTVDAAPAGDNLSPTAKPQQTAPAPAPEWELDGDDHRLGDDFMLVPESGGFRLYKGGVQQQLGSLAKMKELAETQDAARRAAVAARDKLSPPAANPLQAAARPASDDLVDKFVDNELPQALQAALKRGGDEVAQGGQALIRTTLGRILDSIQSAARLTPVERENILVKAAQSQKFKEFADQADTKLKRVDTPEVEAPRDTEAPVLAASDATPMQDVDPEVLKLMRRAANSLGGERFGEELYGNMMVEVLNILKDTPDLPTEKMLPKIWTIGRRANSQLLHKEIRSGVIGLEKKARPTNVTVTKSDGSVVSRTETWEGDAAVTGRDASASKELLDNLAAQLKEKDQKYLKLYNEPIGYEEPVGLAPGRVITRSHEQIGEILGITAKASGRRLAAIKNRIRKLKNLDDVIENTAQTMKAEGADAATVRTAEEWIEAQKAVKAKVVEKVPSEPAPTFVRHNQAAKPNEYKASVAPITKAHAAKAYANMPTTFTDRIMDMLDKGEHLFFANPVIRKAISLFDYDVMGATTLTGQDTTRRAVEAWDQATFAFREMSYPIVHAIGQTGVLDLNKIQETFKNLPPKEARKKAIDVLNQRHSAIRRFMEDKGLDEAVTLDRTVFTDGDLTHDVESHMRMLREVWPAELRRDAFAGLKTPDLIDEFSRYWPRYQHKGYSRGAAKVRAEKVIKTDGAYQKTRRGWTKNLVDGSSVIDDMSLDPNISGTYWDQPLIGPAPTKAQVAADVAYLKSKYLDRLLGDMHYEMKDGKRVKISQAGEAKLRHVARAVARMPMLHRDQQIPFYGRNFLHDFAARVEEGFARRGVALAAQDMAARSTGDGTQFSLTAYLHSLKLTHPNAFKNVIFKKGMGESYTKALDAAVENNTKLFEAGKSRVIKGVGRVSMKEGKFIATSKKRGERVLDVKDVRQFTEEVANFPRKYSERPGVNITVDQTLYEDANRVLKAWGKPAEIGGLQRILRGVLNFFKTHVTVPFPGFHGRNFISGQVQNYFYGAYDPTSTGPGRYLKPLAQAFQMRKGGVVKNLYKEMPDYIRADIDRMYPNITDVDERATRWAASRVFKYGLTGDKQGYSAERASDSAANWLSQAPGAVKPDYLGIFRKEAPGTGWWDRINPLHVRGGGRPVRVPVSKTPAGELAAKASPSQNRWSWKWNDPNNEMATEWQQYEGTSFTPARIGEDLAAVTEDVNRISPFLAFIKQGIDPAEAARRVQAIQVDYSRSSEFDKLMKQWFPFWTFTRGMLPLTFKDLASHPAGKQAWAVRASMRGQDKAHPAPDHILRSSSIRLGETESGAQRYITGLGLPYEDALSFTGFLRGDVRGTASEFGGRLRPEVQGAVELMTGRSLFFDKPLADLDPPMGRLASNIYDTATGNERALGLAAPLGGMGGAEFLIGKTPGARYLSVANSLLDQRRGIANKLLTTSTGIRVSDVEPHQLEMLNIDRAGARLKEFGARDFSTTYLPDWAENRLNPEDQAEAKGWQKFIQNVRAESKRKKKEAEEAAAMLAE